MSLERKAERARKTARLAAFWKRLKNSSYCSLSLSTLSYTDRLLRSPRPHACALITGIGLAAPVRYTCDARILQTSVPLCSSRAHSAQAYYAHELGS